MVTPFKFLNPPLLRSHDGHEIYAGEWFFSVNKNDMESVTNPGTFIPKYTIVRRRVDPIYKNVFKPDHETLWYFKSESNAEWLINIWKRQDERLGGGESIYFLSNTITTLNRQNE